MELLVFGQIPTYEEIQEVRKSLSEMSIKHWRHDDLLSLSWWFLLFSTFMPYIVWWRYVNKTKFYEIFSFGLFCGIVATVLDVVGVDLLLWGYPDKLFSMVPPLFPADICVIPVSSMFIFQWFTKWKSFIIATIIWAAILSFIVEPVFIYFHMFELHDWKHTYSFLGFIVYLLSCRTAFHLIHQHVVKKIQPS
ncbi:CBO0543 family protein [Bacillus pinisoli]|uniref:CBO0543 family protein n=1 Tax=Bacillus pinisoli TaxID=2901866 RepID=UPI001FF52481|nr:CBO0543 family protein [Bacillus pinisoli]